MTRPPRVVGEVLATVRRTLERRAMLKGGERVVLAVSGGADSLTLLHAMARLAPELSLDLHVAHFDHRLRAGSAKDAAFVGREAARLGIPGTVRAADATDTPPRLSPEEAARERRYAFLGEVGEAVGAERIATGHTLDDQAETVLMRILTGGGRRGLGGIPPVRRFIVRPLIDVRRAQTEAFCRALRLRPRRDPTNEDARFLRNAIRRETIPYLERTVNARLRESLARTADVLRDEDYLLDEMAGDAAEPALDADGLRMPVERLRELPLALQRRAIRLAARMWTDGIDAGQTEAVRELAVEGRTGSEIHLPGGLSARVEYGFLVVGPASSPPVPADIRLDVPGETDLPPWGARAQAWLTGERPAQWPDGRAVCVLDAGRIAFPLRVRRWRSGDRFRPLGMSRQKKLSDFFGDGKVPRARRAEVPLVVDGQGTIVWVVGHRIDDRVKVRPGTSRHLWICWGAET